VLPQLLADPTVFDEITAKAAEVTANED
jgi:hypothetical protein